MSKQRSAIVFFSLTASEESKMKSFVPEAGQKSNLAVASGLIHHSYTVARKTELPIFRFTGRDQIGANFGERLANAIETVFDKGYQNLIVIGNDCPEVNTEQLLHVNDELNSNALVLGPATDGGIYLLGIQRAVYSRKDFLEMAWQSEALQESWGKYANDIQQEIFWLNPFADIDNSDDLQHYIRTSATANQLKKYFISILASYQYLYATQSITQYRKRRIPNVPLRAPPYFPL